jgi:hypothetical protein
MVSARGVAVVENWTMVQAKNPDDAKTPPHRGAILHTFTSNETLPAFLWACVREGLLAVVRRWKHGRSIPLRTLAVAINRRNRRWEDERERAVRGEPSVWDGGGDVLAGAACRSAFRPLTEAASPTTGTSP